MGAPDEQIQIVDASNKVIGTKLFKNLTDADTWRIICVWIENSRGQVLLQQRSYKKKLGPGLWTCAVEGTVEDNDSYEETAKREIAEEIGLTKFSLVPAKCLLFKTYFGSRFAQGYTVTCDWPLERFVPQASEVEQLAWVDRNQVIADLQAKDPKYPISAPVWLEMFDLL